MPAPDRLPFARAFVTGANRGIGLELCRVLAEAGTRLYAGCRAPDAASALRELARAHGDHVTIVEVDVTSDASVRAAAAFIGEREDGIDLLVNNAGVNPRGSLASFDAAVALHAFDVNAVGAMRVLTATLPLLKRGSGARVINMSSQLGSLTQQRAGWGSPIYNASKAALNMFTRQTAFALKDQDIAVVAIHPGWVQTDMGGPSAPLSPAACARDVVELAASLTPAMSGSFLVHDGSPHPW